MPRNRPLSAILRSLDSLGWLDVLQPNFDELGATAQYAPDYFLPRHGQDRREEYGAILRELDALGDAEPEIFAARGRLLRLLGSDDQAAAQFRKALALRADCAPALAFEAEGRLLQNRPRDCIGALDKAIAREPRRAAYRVWKAYAHHLSGEAAAAAAEIEEALKSNTKLISARLLSGWVKESFGDFSGAEKDYSRVVKADPRCSGAFTWRAAVRGRLGDLDGATEDAHLAACAEPDNLDAFRRQLSSSIGAPHSDAPAHQARLWQAADDLLRREPGSCWGHAARVALWHVKNADPDQSRMRQYREDLLKVALPIPSRVWAWAFLARITRQMEYLETAVRLAPEVGWVRSWRGQLGSALRHDPAKALADFDAGIRLDPSYRLAYGWRARVRAQRGDAEGAISDLGRCLDVVHQLAFRQQRAALLWQRHEDLPCLEDLQRCMLASSLYAFAYGGLYESMPATERKYPRGFLKMTAARLVDLARRRPAEPLAHAWLARLRLNEGKTAAAGASLNRALALDGECLMALCWRGELSCQKKDHAAALSDLDKALRLAPGFILALLWRARACRGLGDEAGAERSLESARQAARLDPRTDTAKADLISLWVKHALPARRAPAPKSAEQTNRAGLGVDARIELLAVLDLLTKGNRCPLGETGEHYRRALKALDKAHPACRLYAAMEPEDWMNRRPAAVLLGFSPAPLLERGTAAESEVLSRFLKALRDFAKNGFMEFFQKEAGFYSSLLAPLRASIERIDHAGPLERYLGLPLKHRFHCLCSPLYHGFGIEDIRIAAADGISDCYMVNGHSSIGDDGEPQLDLDGPTLGRAAWDQGARCAVEGFVSGPVLARAVACRLTELEFGRAAGLAALNQAQSRDASVGPVCDLLREYERSRRQYPTIAEFCPKIVGPLLPAA